MKKGFTLLELILATIIGSIIISLVVATFLQIARVQDNVTTIQSAHNLFIEYAERLRSNPLDTSSIPATINSSSLTYGTHSFVSVSATIADQSFFMIVRRN
jgi:prepilin-type N-terminal cleavage/methylation domain-containing protein